ncbi:GAF domain-containing protein [Enterovirga sp.]|uniref:GAF domain-containing protein n=1 Tax=Enterovirga sp. TaxID=2026350 RepID=UPI0026041606|nr:GAF domain-containing protein [Enterovirga sp.]
MPLAAKLAAALIGLVTLVLLVNGAINLWLSYQEAKTAAVSVQQEKAHAAAERIGQFVAEIENQMGWTTRAEWRRVPLEQQRYDFIRLLRQAPAITEISYLDAAGKEQLKVSRLEPDAVGSQIDLSGEPKFLRAIAEKSWFGPVYLRRGSEPYMTIAVAHAGRNPGVTVAEVNLKLIWDVITAIRIGQKGYAFVVNSQGRLIAHPDLSLVLRDTDLSRLPQVASALAGVPGQSNAAEIVEAQDGARVLSAHAPIARLRWLVFVQLPVKEALAPVYTSLAQTAALLGLGLLLASVAGTYLARRMVVPIRRLQDGAERLGGGDLSERITIRTGDEIETLAVRFNQMASRIQESHETLEAKVVERTRDLNETLQQQTATADVLKVISRSAFDLDAVFKTVIESAAHLCGSNRALIYLKDGEVFRPAAGFGVSPEFWAVMESNPMRPERGTFVGRTILERGPIHVPDVDADPEFTFTEASRVGRFKSILCVPLLREGDPIGVLALSRPAAGPFTARQISLVTTFADQAVIAIENARLFDEVQARTAELSESLQQQTATADVLKVISRSAFNLDVVLTTLVESAARLCEAEKGVIFLRQGGHFGLCANVGFSAEFETFARANPFPFDRGSTTMRAAASGGAVQVVDVLADESRSALAREYQRLGGYRTNLGVPLMREGEPIGVFTLTRQVVRPFTERQIELVQTFADQAVIAIQNARLFEEVKERTAELQQSLDDLRKAQDRLVQSEKLASLGQLTAGIAHEIKNPLNFVNNFSLLSADLIDELRQVLEPASLDERAREEVDELTGMLKGNLEKVVQHGKRADSIVKNMLLHSREGVGEHRPVEVNAIVEESMNLAYHGARAEKPSFNVTLRRELDPATGEADLYPQEITRVLLNLFSNSFYAATKRKAELDGAFDPTITATTRNLGDRVEIRVRDNGTGIPEDVKAKMFNPFFTTKPAGEGTGLGLSLSHDIVVKQHGGTIEVASSPGQFTEFTITLPRAGAATAAAKRGA